MTPFLVATVLAYLVATTLYLGDIFARNDWSVWGRRVMLAAAAINLLALGVGIASEGRSLLAMPRGLLWVTLLPVIGYLLLSRRYAIAPLGALVAPTAVLLLAAVALSGPVRVSEPLMGGILPVHVTLAFIGTSAFALAFFGALLYAVQAYQLKHKRFGRLFRALPPLHELDDASFRCVAVGFPVYTAAILLGVVFWMAQGGANRYTGYALASTSWLIYGIVLQARLTAGWRGPRAAALTAVGFLAAAGVVIAYAAT